MAGPEAQVLQQLYDSEINGAIETFWDCGFEWRLGDRLNDYVAHGCAATYAEAAAALAQAAIAYFPDS